MTIPGVGPRTAEVLIAEVGLDMTVFPTAGHLASWAGICPGNNSSGGKRRPARTRHGSMWLRIALTEAAQVAARGKNTYLAAHHAQIRGSGRVRRDAGVRIKLTPLRDPESKGLVERRNGYFETSFLPGRTFISPFDFNAQIQAWLTGTAHRAAGFGP